MTKEQLLKQLRKIARDPNMHHEEGHIAADKLLLEYINDPKVTAAFKVIDKWYA